MRQEVEQAEQTSWKDEVGLSDKTCYVVIYPNQTFADEWKAEADEQGLSRSKYLIELIQEARAKRQGTLSARDGASKRVEELEREIDQLEAQLEETHQSPSIENELADYVNVEPQLTKRYQRFPGLVSSVIEHEQLRTEIEMVTEEQLFELADEDKTEYKSGHGWRLTTEGEQ